MHQLSQPHVAAHAFVAASGVATSHSFAGFQQPGMPALVLVWRCGKHCPSLSLLIVAAAGSGIAKRTGSGFQQPGMHHYAVL